MPAMRGKCTNFGNCQKADSQEFIDVAPGVSPICPMCQRPLTMVPVARSGPPVGVIAAVVIALLVIGILFKVLSGKKESGGTPSMPVATTPPPSSNGPDLGSTPAGTQSDPQVHPGDALMYFERSDEKWLRVAAEDFNKQHESQPQIVLDFRGSREGKQDILYGKGKPVIWNPADTYWVDKLNLDWRNPSVGKHSDDVVGDSKTILSTRLVLVFWDDRAKVLASAMNRSEYRGKTWQLLYDIATQGWSKAGGPAAWGKLKLAQTDPTKSNSGQAALALMFSEYTKSNAGATPSSGGFMKFMKGVESSVSHFDETTSKSLDVMLKGSHDDIDGAVCYETNALSAVDGHKDIRIIYPSPTVAINFPAAVVKADWVDEGEAKLANQFIDYLLTPDVQKQALQYGFRPAIDNMRSDVDNAFSAGDRGSAGFILDPTTVDRPVSTKIVDDLLFQWYKTYGSGGAAP